MFLGENPEISLSVSSVDEHVRFFEGLGFRPVTAPQQSVTAASMSDGTLTLTFYETEFSSPTLSYFSSPLDTIKAQLAEQNIAFRVCAFPANSIEFTDPNGLRVVLCADARPERKPFGEANFSRCGTFGEFSVPTANRDASAAFWRALGFEALHESNAPYPWGIYGDSKARLPLQDGGEGGNEFYNGTIFGFHQTADFRTPGITFFSKDCKERVAALKNDGFVFKPNVEHAILSTPGGQELFIFCM